MRSALTVFLLVLMLATGITPAYGEENASNPLAAVNNTDLRLRAYELTNGQDRIDYSIEQKQ